MTEEEFKNKKEKGNTTRFALKQKAMDRWADILRAWNLLHPDVSIAVGHTTFLGIMSTRVTMQWPDGSSISREISYTEYPQRRDPEQYIIDIFDKMYKEGSQKDA